MILTNARLILPDGIREGFEVIVEEGKIGAIRETQGATGSEIVDLGGNYLAPGFVDLHIHGALGRDTMEASTEAFRTICDYHATGGTTSLLLTTASAPIEAIIDVLRAVRDAGQSIRQIAGVHVEGPFISKNKRGAQHEKFIQEPTTEAIDLLLEHVNVIKRLTIAPELPGAAEAIERFATRGVSVSGGHSDAWDEEAREAFAHGMRSATHTFNCMSSARRRGVQRVAGLLEFAMSEPQINCELIADRHHVSTTLMKMLYRAKGAAGISLVTDATAGAGQSEGSRFSLYGNECVVEDGVCLLADRSALAGSASRMIDLVRTMVNDVGVPLHEAVAMATITPARAIGVDKTKGKIAVGADADLVALSQELKVLKTFVQGAVA